MEQYFNLIAIVDGLMVTQDGTEFGVLIMPESDFIHTKDLIEVKLPTNKYRHVHVTVFARVNLVKFTRQEDFITGAIPAMFKRAARSYPDPADGFCTVVVHWRDYLTREVIDWAETSDCPHQKHTIENVAAKMTADFIIRRGLSTQEFESEISVQPQTGLRKDFDAGNWNL